MFGPQGGDQSAMIAQALQARGGAAAPQPQPQNTPQMQPMQQEVMMGPGPMAPQAPAPATAMEIQEQLTFLMEAINNAQDPAELQQLSNVARELQVKLEEALQMESLHGDSGMLDMSMLLGGGGF